MVHGAESRVRVAVHSRTHPLQTLQDREADSAQRIATRAMKMTATCESSMDAARTPRQRDPGTDRLSSGAAAGPTRASGGQILGTDSAPADPRVRLAPRFAGSSGIGAGGFEPPASCPQSRRSARLSYAPESEKSTGPGCRRVTLRPPAPVAQLDRASAF